MPKAANTIERFYEVSNPMLATSAIAIIQDIYAVEAIAKQEGLKSEKKTAICELAGPQWEMLKHWCMGKMYEVPEDTLTYKAMGYLLRHYNELTAYMGIAEMPADINVSEEREQRELVFYAGPEKRHVKHNDTERKIRCIVMGKQSYLFCRTNEACQRAALIYSMLGACKVLGKDAEKWLAYTLKQIGSTKPEDMHRLLPEEWTE